MAKKSKSQKQQVGQHEKLKEAPRLQKYYQTTVQEQLKEKLGFTNPMRVPKMVKIILNMGIGDARENANALNNAVGELTLISGQKPVITYAKKAISNFKIRAKDPVGVRVTLRGALMWEFLDRFISLATPRIRDFRGLPARGFDGRGNYNFGITEQIVFPEIEYDKVDKIRGMNITMVTTGETDEEAHELLLALGMPIRQKAKADQNEEAA